MLKKSGVLMTFWLTGVIISRIKIDDENLISRIGNVTSILEFITQYSEVGMAFEMKLDRNYTRLRELIKKTI